MPEYKRIANNFTKHTQIQHWFKEEYDKFGYSGDPKFVSTIAAQVRNWVKATLGVVIPNDIVYDSGWHSFKVDTNNLPVPIAPMACIIQKEIKSIDFSLWTNKDGSTQIVVSLRDTE